MVYFIMLHAQLYFLFVFDFPEIGVNKVLVLVLVLVRACSPVFVYLCVRAHIYFIADKRDA